MTLEHLWKYKMFLTFRISESRKQVLKAVEKSCNDELKDKASERIKLLTECEDFINNMFHQMEESFQHNTNNRMLITSLMEENKKLEEKLKFFDK